MINSKLQYKSKEVKKKKYFIILTIEFDIPTPTLFRPKRVKEHRHTISGTVDYNSKGNKEEIFDACIQKMLIQIEYTYKYQVKRKNISINFYSCEEVK